MPKNPVASDITTIRRTLRTLDSALGRLAASLGSVRTNGAAPVKRKLNLTPARKAALKLQGQCMGYLRNLKPKQKAEVKALKAAKGIRPAIARAKQLGAA